MLPGLRDRAPVVDGQPVILGPYSPMPDYSVGPARMVGMTGGERKPLLHAKLLVLGRLAWLEYDTDVGTFEEYRFLPRSVWCGSTNWTEQARSHLELVAWADGPTLVRAATEVPRRPDHVLRAAGLGVARARARPRAARR